MENVDALESRIVKLNGKIASIKRKHKDDKNVLPRIESSVIRCSKCESYRHETHQCSNCNASLMTNEDLKNYTLHLTLRFPHIIPLSQPLSNLFSFFSLFQTSLSFSNLFSFFSLFLKPFHLLISFSQTSSASSLFFANLFTFTRLKKR